MRKLQIKFPNQIRISGWDFGSSARAMNQAGGKDSLMTYLRVFFIQAESGKCPGSTFERKTMSSTIKRVALVAVASMGLGLITTVSSNAVAPTNFEFVTAESISTDKDTAVTVAGAANYVEIISKADVAGTSARVDVTGGSFVDIAEETDADTDWAAPAVTYNVGASSAVIASGDLLGTDGAGVDTLTLRINTPTVGTATIKVYSVALVNGVATDTLTDTLTVTVNATATAGVVVASTSTSIIDKDAANAAGFNAAADDTVLAAKAAGTLRAIIKVTAKDANTVLLPNGKTVTATISGPGLLGGAAADIDTYANSSKSETVTLAGGTGLSYFGVYSDGTAGVATITITSGTVTLATETVTFYGDVATLSVTQVAYSLSDAAAATVFATISAKDSAGNAVAIAGADGSPSTTNGTFTDANGATAGTVDVSLDPTADSLGSKSTTWTHTATGKTIDLSVIVAKAVASKVTISTDKDEYVPGEKVTVTVSAVDASGYIVADGNRLLLKDNVGILSSAALSGSTLPTDETVALSNGKATYTLYAPLLEGPVTLSATEGTDTASTTKAEITAKFSVVASNGGTTAAIDAANEATDAANAATDAANAAAEAADAATAAAQDAQAAVAALATQVASLIAGIKAQITTLTNLVIKIQKKVKA
jgi:hypothetical protein